MSSLACRSRKLPSMAYVRAPTITCNAQSRIGRNGVPSKSKFLRKERSMPSYVCYLPRDRFTPDQKRQIVDAITFRHSEATGAPSYFVQVVIEEARADRYLGANTRLITSGSAVIYVRVAPSNSGQA
jgi:phenylpyruvate tautomerase PptA (4-oxalocrotonate tautomerase family)